MFINFLCLRITHNTVSEIFYSIIYFNNSVYFTYVYDLSHILLSFWQVMNPLISYISEILSNAKNYYAFLHLRPIINIRIKNIFIEMHSEFSTNALII
jgi:hypothetical protein